MKNSIFFLICGAFFLLMIASCKVVDRYPYSPATANLLQAERKNDVKISANYTTVGQITTYKGESRKSNGFDAQGIYAFSSRFAVGAATYKKWEENKSINQTSGSGYRYRKSGAELSFGVYNFSKTKERSVFQLFAGIGLGKGSITGFYTDSLAFRESHFSKNNKYFLQPTLTIKAGERGFIVLATRLNIVHFNNIESNMQDPKRDGLIFLGQKNSVFQDFILNETFSFKNPAGLGLQFQQGITGLYTRFNDPANINTNYQYNNLWFSAGVVWDLSKAFK